MSNSLKIAGGILLGTAIGAGIGLLMAPTSGRKSRNFIAKKSKKYSAQALDMASDYINDMRKSYNKKVDSFAQNGKSSIEHLKDAISI